MFVSSYNWKTLQRSCFCNYVFGVIMFYFINVVDDFFYDFLLKYSFD